MSGQLDIYGEEAELLEPPAPIRATPADVEQPRLFEPQMEGQLTLGENGAP